MAQARQLDPVNEETKSDDCCSLKGAETAKKVKNSYVVGRNEFTNKNASVLATRNPVINPKNI